MPQFVIIAPAALFHKKRRARIRSAGKCLVVKLLDFSPTFRGHWVPIMLSLAGCPGNEKPSALHLPAVAVATVANWRASRAAKPTAIMSISPFVKVKGFRSIAL